MSERFIASKEFEPLPEEMKSHDTVGVPVLSEPPKPPPFFRPREKMQRVTEMIDQLEDFVTWQAKSDASRDRIRWAIDRMYAVIRREL